MRLSLLCLLAALFSSLNAMAVEMNGTFDTTVPTVAGWDSGWNPADPMAQTYDPDTGNGYTGWDYVGNVDGASGVYLGDDWVLSVSHVAGSNAGTAGAADFTLGTGPAALTYVNTGEYFTFGTSDLVLFQVADPTDTLANLPSLSLATSAPADYLNSTTASGVVMIGYGGAPRNATVPVGAKSWGMDTVTLSSQTLQVTSSVTYTSTDFLTADPPGFKGQSNNSEVVPGDSGGGDFIYNSTTHLWQLAGLNEAYGEEPVYRDTTTGKDFVPETPYNNTTNPQPPTVQYVGDLDFSAYVQISAYENQIATDMAPEPPAWVLAAGGLTLLGLLSRFRRRLSL